MLTAKPPPTIIPEPATRKELQLECGGKTSACFQCAKCTNGCPLTFAMDISPHRVVHFIQLGMAEEILNSDTIWVCASCETCTTRCPNDIDIAHVMDKLRQMSIKNGIKLSQKQVPVFHASFLSSIKRFGRVHEVTMALAYALRSEGIGGIFKQAKLGLNMFRKGKIRLTPYRLIAGKDIKDIFRRSERNQE
jgi:heterodisulfide reductase subunit C2